MDTPRLLKLIGALVTATTLSACSQDRVTPPPVRSVKLETVSKNTPAATRFVATVRQRQHAELAFENSGQIASIDVEVGDHVHRGQLLARLDPTPARLRRQQTQASLAAVTAQLQEHQIQMRQQQAMFDDGLASQAALTGAETALATARARVRGAHSDLELAMRALRVGELRAPFDGTVVARQLQPQAQVAPGQTVLTIEGQGHPQAIALLPPDRAAALVPGADVQAQYGNHTLTLRARGVSSQLESGATVQTIFDLASSPASVRSGESLLLTLPAPDSHTLSVPLAGVLPTAHSDVAVVFVYQTVSGTVQRREVRLGEIEGGRVQVRSGLVPGEQVVAAGAAFLGEGQNVVPFHPVSQLTDGDAP